ncbi:hypothetical protein ABH853_07005 [Pseudomonas sp. 13.2]|uniref:Diguanylate phosphodiesterase n=1 Tax=Pseudomonas sp. 13.2 TaxID=3144665 RepID=A0AAU7BK37_9PSED
MNPTPARVGHAREYGGGGNGERRVEFGQQARPFAGEPAPTTVYTGPSMHVSNH